MNWNTYLIFLLGVSTRLAMAEDDPYERAPISYSRATPEDAVTRLQTKIASGLVRFDGGEKRVVSRLLSELRIPESSQMLVFSKTSFQKDRINPAHPRALYFSDEAYVGWCPGGLVEVAAIDPILGPVFYSFNLNATGEERKFQRDTDCLRCHGGTFIRDIPGLLARSVYTDAGGQPLLALGSELVDATTPIEKRWGGWYVTALHAGPRHRGNLVLSNEQEPGPGVLAANANLKTLAKMVDTRPYLVPTSDVTALLVFEHQVSVQNVLTRANQQCLRMMAYQKNLQQELKEAVSEEPAYESVRHVFTSACEQVLDALLCKDEAALPEGGISGVSVFAKEFATGASATLKELDLRNRLFRYRCSYLITSSMFDHLQPALRKRVLRRLWRVLSDPQPEPRYEYLERAERETIRSVVAASVPNLPSTWRVSSP